jgi:AraC-like DNA-binding protein/mannose-6-phosphate isomerase-like protein (cupin superfamily)
MQQKITHLINSDCMKPAQEVVLACAHISHYEGRVEDSKPHQHPYVQVLYVIKGVIRVQTCDGYFIIPPTKAIWIPPKVDHLVRFSGSLEIANLYLSDEVLNNTEIVKNCKLFPVNNLLRELFIKICELSKVTKEKSLGGHILNVILNLITFEDTQKFYLTRPQDPRLTKIVQKVEKDIARNETLKQLAQSTGASAKTLSRLFYKELNMTFSQWRGQLRVFKAIEWLAQGVSVTSVGFEVGFESTSSFISFFKKVTGKTPAKFFD